jgi:hypothetical protein
MQRFARFKLAALVLTALAALAAATAGNAVAKPSVLLLTQKGTYLEPQSYFELEDNTGYTVGFKEGTVQCPTSAEDGVVGLTQNNAERKDEIKLDVTVGGFTRDGCTSSTPLGSTAQVEAHTHGRLYLGSNGKAELISENDISPPGNSEVSVYWEHSLTNCVYKFVKLKGAVIIGDPIMVQFSKQKLKLTGTENGKLCPKTAELSMKFDKTFYYSGEYYFIEGTVA